MDKLRLLEKAIEQLKLRGKRYSESEAEYRVALAGKLLELRQLGHPVTMLHDLARGNPDISKLRLLRDIAEMEHQTAMEFINVTKLTCRILEAQISREWGSKND